MKIEPKDIQFFKVFLENGDSYGNFNILDEKRSLVETIGIFPGTPDFHDTGFAYVARKLEVYDGSLARCKAVVKAKTFDEAEWVAYGLAKKVAEDLNGNNLLGICDATSKRKKENPYEEESRWAYQMIGKILI
ncbi:MAG: hypothetical protein V1888_02110 [archaeon]